MQQELIILSMGIATAFGGSVYMLSRVGPDILASALNKTERGWTFWFLGAVIAILSVLGGVLWNRMFEAEGALLVGSTICLMPAVCVIFGFRFMKSHNGLILFSALMTSTGVFAEANLIRLYWIYCTQAKTWWGL